MRHKNPAAPHRVIPAQAGIQAVHAYSGRTTQPLGHKNPVGNSRGFAFGANRRSNRHRPPGAGGQRRGRLIPSVTELSQPLLGILQLRQAPSVAAFFDQRTGFVELGFILKQPGAGQGDVGEMSFMPPRSAMRWASARSSCAPSSCSGSGAARRGEATGRWCCVPAWRRPAMAALVCCWASSPGGGRAAGRRRERSGRGSTGRGRGLGGGRLADFGPC